MQLSYLLTEDLSDRYTSFRILLLAKKAVCKGIQKDVQQTSCLYFLYLHL